MSQNCIERHHEALTHMGMTTILRLSKKNANLCNVLSYSELRKLILVISHYFSRRPLRVVSLHL